MDVQLGFFESVFDLLGLDLRFILGGIVLVGGSIYWLHKRKMLTVKIGIVLVIFYYYLGVVLSHIVGIPTIKEWMRLSSLGESLFHPNVNLIPFADGLGMEFLLNIFCFIPLGFFCPLISREYEQVKKAVLIGFGFSFMIELSQLFTLYRATDINDLIANTLGTVIGCLCFKFILKLKQAKSANPNNPPSGLPILYVTAAFVITFLQF